MKESQEALHNLISEDSTNIFELGFSAVAREIQLIGSIDDNSFKLFDSQLTVLENISHAPVTIKIDSEGGSSDTAVSIVVRMRESPCKLITKGYGQVQSAATIIMAAGDKREMSDLCNFMWHEGSYGIQDRHSNVKHQVIQQERDAKKWASIMAKFTKKPVEFWLKKGEGRDLFLSPDECLKFGVVDKLFSI